MKAWTPVNAIYGAVVATRNALYDRDILKARRLDWPVVSIGNIRAGGTGKTPFIIHLGKLLQEGGIPFDVLSRGYGRNDEKKIALVDPKGSPADFGDEPILISQKLGVPVIVGADRYAAGKFAEAMFANTKPAHGAKWLHLLDDGFQHRGLHRDFDLVLVSPTDASDSLLPAGRLREPVTALHRADAIVLVDDARGAGLRLDSQHIWRTHRDLVVSELPPLPVAFCGVARADRFFDDLHQSGIELAAQQSFSDHHRYSDSDVRSLADLRKRHNAGGFVTTEKDMINLAGIAPELNRLLHPIKVVPMDLKLEEEASAVGAILEACGIPRQAETINRSP